MTTDGVLTAGSYVCINGTIYVLVVSALAAPPAGIALVFVAGIGLCYIAGQNLYYSPAHAWDNTAREAALKEVEFFADYPVPPYSGPFDINPDEVGVTWPEFEVQTKVVFDSSRSVVADARREYINRVGCEDAADNTRNQQKETAKSTSGSTGTPAVAGSGEAASGGPKKDDDDDDDGNHMVGENGTRTNGSVTTGRNGSTERVDVENMAPGTRPGNVHYHEPNNKKWIYDIIIKIKAKSDYPLKTPCFTAFQKG